MSVLGHVTYDLRKIDGTAGGSLVVLGVKGQSLFSEVTKGRECPRMLGTGHMPSLNLSCHRPLPSRV